MVRTLIWEHLHAGAAHGQEMAPERMEHLIHQAGRVPMQRTTAYAKAPAERVAASRSAPPLKAPVNTPLSEDTRRASRRPARDLVRPGLETEAGSVMP